MVNPPPSQGPPHPSPDEVNFYLMDQLDVSPDIRIIEPATLISIVGTALTERHSTAVFNRPDTRGEIDNQYANFLNQEALPPHLQSKEAFTARYHKLIGNTPEELFTCEALTTITRNRKNPPIEVQRQFEYSMARLTVGLLSMAIKKRPILLETLALNTTVGLARTAEGNFLETGDGMRQPLARSHSSVIQAAPTIKDAFGRCSEIGRGGWESVATLSSTYYNEEFVRSVAQVIFGLSPQKRIFASGEGLANGCKLLAEEIKGNKKLKSGFGAMILSDISHLPREDIHAAIDASPRLLRRGGLLLISDLCSFPEQEGSVFELINHTRAIFGHDPNFLGVMTMDDNREGRQAVFVKQ